MHCVAVWCGVLQCLSRRDSWDSGDVAVCCSVLQYLSDARASLSRRDCVIMCRQTDWSIWLLFFLKEYTHENSHTHIRLQLHIYTYELTPHTCTHKCIHNWHKSQFKIGYKSIATKSIPQTSRNRHSHQRFTSPSLWSFISTCLSCMCLPVSLPVYLSWSVTFCKSICVWLSTWYLC